MQKGQRWFRYAINRTETTHALRKRNRLARMMERPARPIRLLDIMANMAREKILLLVLKEVEKEMPIPRESNVIFDKPVVIEVRIVTEKLKQREASMSWYERWCDPGVIEPRKTFVRKQTQIIC